MHNTQIKLNQKLVQNKFNLVGTQNQLAHFW